MPPTTNYSRLDYGEILSTKCLMHLCKSKWGCLALGSVTHSCWARHSTPRARLGSQYKSRQWLRYAWLGHIRHGYSILQEFSGLKAQKSYSSLLGFVVAVPRWCLAVHALSWLFLLMYLASSHPLLGNLVSVRSHLVWRSNWQLSFQTYSILETWILTFSMAEAYKATVDIKQSLRQPRPKLHGNIATTITILKSKDSCPKHDMQRKPTSTSHRGCSFLHSSKRMWIT